MVSEFIQRYFIDPIIYDQPYNIYNTTVYAIILVVAAYGFYKLLEKWKINVNKEFVYAIVPYVFFGALFRTWEDAGIVTNPFFITPGSYIITFILLFSGLLLGRLLEKSRNIPYHKPMMYFGIFLSILAFAIFLIYPIKNLFGMLAVLGIFAVWAFIIHFADKYFLKLGRLASYSIKAHLLDASATFVALQFFADKYGEQHVLPAFVIDALGPASFFILKLVVIVPIVWIIVKYTKPEEIKWRKYLLLLILVLGLAPGLRDFFRIALFV